MGKFELYWIDIESTGTSYIDHEPVEISIYRTSDGIQRTWHCKPINLDKISSDALRVNGLKIEDLRGDTKEGREKYQDPTKVIVEIENWLTENLTSAEDRICAGQNVSFDKLMLESLWKKCNSEETFPFNKKYIIDTMQIQFLIDHCKEEVSEGYSLYALTKKYGVKNKDAHSAASDVLATREVFLKQMSLFKKLLNDENSLCRK